MPMLGIIQIEEELLACDIDCDIVDRAIELSVDTTDERERITHLCMELNQTDASGAWTLVQQRIVEFMDQLPYEMKDDKVILDRMLYVLSKVNQIRVIQPQNRAVFLNNLRIYVSELKSAVYSHVVTNVRLRDLDTD